MNTQSSNGIVEACTWCGSCRGGSSMPPPTHLQGGMRSASACRGLPPSSTSSTVCSDLRDLVFGQGRMGKGR